MICKNYCKTFFWTIQCVLEYMRSTSFYAGSSHCLMDCCSFCKEFNKVIDQLIGVIFEIK